MTKTSPSSPESDEPRTETTLTTRIRINIPGSRPIPPVVVRKPVAAGEDKEPDRPSEASKPAEPSAASAPADGPKADQQSDWFAPRKGAALPATPARPALGPGSGRGAAAAPASSGGTDMNNGSGPHGGPAQGQRPGAALPPRTGLPTRPVGGGGAPGA
ncbi:hypothetical protein ACM614_05415, partial [Streptomyces sp. 12297]